MGLRVVPSERLRHELDALIADAGELHDPIEEIGRLGARLIIQQALEGELSEFLGRARYERTGELVAHHYGYERPQKIATTSGAMEIERPRVRDASRLGFESRIVGKGVAHTYALETLVICSFLRGLSVRDVEAAFEETFGEPVISKSTVSRVLEDTRERYRVWCKRRLDEHDLVYCLLDAIYLKLRPDDEPAEGVLALVADYERSYPSAARVITDNVEQLVAHLRFPLAHRKRTRSTNLLERTFVEVRRRTKVIGRFPGETSALSLIWAVLELSSRGWRGVEMTPKTVAELGRIRRRARSTDAVENGHTKEVVAP